MRCGKKDEKEGEGEGKEEEKKNRKWRRRYMKGTSPNTFPSTKLGNNMTPIKGILGKNTTPTSRNPIEPDQNLQMNPPQRRSNFEVVSLQI